MVRFFITVAIISSALCARENPFFPPKDLKTPTYTTNEIVQKPPFSSQTFHLPSSARILKSVTLTYENLDGSLASKKVNIDKRVDWHKELYLGYKQKSFTREVATNARSREKVLKQEAMLRKLGSLGFITVYAAKGMLKFVTKDRLLRHFKLVKPDRIVLDFKKDTSFKTKTLKGAWNFKRVTFGNHKGYYRAVIELDGRYIYKIRKSNGEYILKVY